MITYQSNEEQSGFSGAKPRIKPLILLSGFYAFGLFGFFAMLRSPASYGILWDQGIAFSALSFGGILGAVLLIAANRVTSGRRLKVKTMAFVSIVLAAFAGIAFLLSAALPLQTPTLEMCALFLVGFGTPCTVFSWVIVYRSLTFRNVLLNSGMTYVLLSFLLFACSQFASERFTSIYALFLFIGSAALLLFKNSLSLYVDGAVTQDSKKNDVDEGISPRRFFMSVPFAGFMLYALTTGLVLKGSSEISYPLLVGVGVFLAIALVLLLSFVRFSQIPDHQLMFYLYGFGLPAIAVIAFFIKMIPIDFISSVLFREFMKVYFQLILLASWTYLVGCARIDGFKPAFVCGVSQIVVSLSFLMGNLISDVGSPISTTILGLITAVFLLFASITVGRNFIAFAKGPETADELGKNPLDMESVCARVSLEYKLSPRETEVLRELAYGHSSSYVAKVLIISNNTARTHMKNIYKKLDINSREDLLELLRNRQRPEQ